MPAIWFRYELSPITVRYIEKNKPFYTFLTTVSILLVFYTLLFFSFDWNKMVVVDKSQTASWSCGSWIYNFLCSQCLSPLKVWVWIRVSSPNKTDRHNITKILLKVALSTITPNPLSFIYYWRYLHKITWKRKQNNFLAKYKIYKDNNNTIRLFRIISILSKVFYFRLPNHMILMEC
jgi:hypothetical protein